MELLNSTGKSNNATVSIFSMDGGVKLLFTDYIDRST